MVPTTVSLGDLNPPRGSYWLCLTGLSWRSSPTKFVVRMARGDRAAILLLHTASIPREGGMEGETTGTVERRRLCLSRRFADFPRSGCS